MVRQVITFISTVNRIVVFLLGGLLAIGITGVIADITLRKLGSSLGGTDELSGYLMALRTAWGMSFALSQHAHIRIEILLDKSTAWGRVALDTIALLSLTTVATLITIKSWTVIEKSWLLQSTANTPLETPLWLVQGPWFLGWAWFSVSCWAYLICFIVLCCQMRLDQAKDLVSGQTHEAGLDQ